MSDLTPASIAGDPADVLCREPAAPYPTLASVPLTKPKSLPPQRQPPNIVHHQGIVRLNRQTLLLKPEEIAEDFWEDKQAPLHISINGRAAYTSGTELLLTGKGPRVAVHFTWLESWWKWVWKRVKGFV